MFYVSWYVNSTFQPYDENFTYELFCKLLNWETVWGAKVESNVLSGFCNLPHLMASNGFRCMTRGTGLSIPENVTLHCDYLRRDDETKTNLEHR